ncbi:GreA/GreB family elongation factor [Neobacillus mesonae]|nr:GreA/GreB family elongation factor [Neobacillus mesonae]
MSHSLLLEGSRNQLINQLVYLDEDLPSFLDEYYPTLNKQRSIVENTLKKYASIIEGILTNFTDNNLNTFVLIGSKVTIQYLDDSTSESFVIVFPSNAEPDKNSISFLSPIGLQLLMAQEKEVYDLDIPSGTIQIRVEKIQFYNNGNLE